MENNFDRNAFAALVPDSGRGRFDVRSIEGKCIDWFASNKWEYRQYLEFVYALNESADGADWPSGYFEEYEVAALYGLFGCNEVVRKDAGVEVVEYEEVSYIPEKICSPQWILDGSYEKYDIPSAYQFSDIAARYLAGSVRSYVFERYLVSALIWSELIHLMRDTRIREEANCQIFNRRRRDKYLFMKAREVLASSAGAALFDGCLAFVAGRPRQMWARNWAMVAERAEKVFWKLDEAGCNISGYAWLIVREADRSRGFL